MELNTQIQYMPGVGPRRAMLLEKLNIKTLKDLIFHFPTRYEDRGNFVSISHLQPGSHASIIGVIQNTETKITSRKNFYITNATLSDKTGFIILTWFNQKWKKAELDKIINKPVIVYGQVEFDGYNKSIKSPQYEVISDEMLKAGRIVPIYPLTEGVDGDWLREKIHEAVTKHINEIKEDLPFDIRKKYNLMDKTDAIYKIHFPDSEKDFEKARERLVFDELFSIQLGLAIRRRVNSMPGKGIAFGIPENFKKELKEIIPFELTDAQKNCIKEILSDMTKNTSMNRLLQGDVGSGKTIVALAAMLFCVRNNYQAAFMAPTEILAQQHYMSLTNLLSNLGLLDINVVLLKGSMRAKMKRETLASIENGSANIIVGTHALISKDVDYKNLGLIIIDEQHKFGVMQRGKLKEKGLNPDVLVMTATPIPRTLTLMVYGDLSVSIINEMPKGRKPVITHHKTRDEREKVYNSLKKLLDMGEKAYVVCPLIEESEKMQLKAATELFDELNEVFLKDYNIALLHGKMKSEEKNKIMDDFREGDTQVLVSTIVIEVGVDVPSANTIIIEDAERFGLSQLHQLRGRVGRGGKQGFCVLISDCSTEESKKRMEIMTKTSNGFTIAEEDLILRGPGEFCGTRQSGLNGLKIANIFTDTQILEKTKVCAEEILNENPTLQGEDYYFLRKAFIDQIENLNIMSIS